MQYQVPQFIEVEDKIFGPLTFRQFAYLAGAGGICLVLFTLLPLWLALPLMVPFAALGLALAFYKVNDRPFISVMESAFKYFFAGKLYLWKQRPAQAPKSPQAAAAPRSVAPVLPTVTEGKLKDLAWSLNIKDRERLGVTSDEPTGLEL